MSRGPDPRVAAARAPDPGDLDTVHSLHLWRAHPVGHDRGPDHAPRPHPDRPKPDRFLVGAIAGAALFYLVGRALGLGRRRGAHAEP